MTLLYLCFSNYFYLNS